MSYSNSCLKKSFKEELMLPRRKDLHGKKWSNKKSLRIFRYGLLFINHSAWAYITQQYCTTPLTVYVETCQSSECPDKTNVGSIYVHNIRSNLGLSLTNSVSKHGRQPGVGGGTWDMFPHISVGGGNVNPPIS